MLPFKLSVFVDVAFIALDAENLCELNDKRLGDNKFPYYKGLASQKLQRELDEEDNEDESNIQQEHANGEIFEVLKAYLPPSVLTFLLDPNPLRFLNRTP